MKRSSTPFRTIWLLLFLIVLTAVCGTMIFWPKDSGTIARITRSGQLVTEIDLSSISESQVIELKDENGVIHNVIWVEAGQICMAESDCPDQVCVRQGWIHNGALPIVCLPNQVVIEIVGEEGNLDVIAK